MRKAFAHRSLDLRAFVAAIVLALLAMQATSLLAPVFSGGRGQTTEAVAWRAAHCAQNSNDGAPAPHDGHAQCCLACSDHGRDPAYLAVALLLAVIVALSPRRVGQILRSAEYSPRLRPQGFASSWSSRAPPRAA